ncbi:hypothetical protein ACJMK2_036402 [Sinanodonta woodiana]|uniref:G-protein coupled receptors family 1 profile domain-containing protein n=1 Tax=Sinanodonta woodiana TaxID=1069815 RepID=A0ABD3WL67_SINWO
MAIVRIYASNVTEQERILFQLNEEMAKSLLPVVCVLATLMCIGFIGNSSVLYVYRSKTSRKTERIFIMFLAVLDSINCLFAMPLEIYDIQHLYLFENMIFCKLMRLVEYCVTITSGLVLVSISFDRYYSICKPLQQFTGRKAKLVCSLCVSLAVLLSWPVLYFANSRDIFLEFENLTGKQCSMAPDDALNYHLYRIYYICLASVMLICAIVLVLVYTLIGTEIHRWLKRQRRARKHSYPSVLTNSHSSAISNGMLCNVTTPSVSSSGRAQEICIRSAAVFFSVTLTFILSFLPHLVVRFHELMNEPIVGTNKIMTNVLIRSYLINNVVNPFIYSILNKRFREKLVETFSKCKIK